MTNSTGDNGFNVWYSLGNFVFGLLRINIMLLPFFVPMLLLFMFAADPLSAFPAVLLSAWIASPGIAALYAAMRDYSDLHFTSKLDLRTTSEAALESGNVALPWWHENEYHAVVKPFWRAVRALWIRALAVSALPLLVALFCFADASMFMGSSYGGYVIPIFIMLGSFSLAAWHTALVTITELPNARILPTVRTAYIQTFRKWYLGVLSIIVMGVLLAALIAQPILGGVFGTGLLLYVVWANARWMVLPVVEAVTKECEAEAKK